MSLWQKLKEKKTLKEVYNVFLKIIPKWAKHVKAKITYFLTSNTSSSLPHFFNMLDNSDSLNVLKSECLSTWDCSWMSTVCLFLWNLKMVCRSPYRYKSTVLISIFFQLEINLYWGKFCGPIWITCLRLKQTERENNCHLVIYSRKIVPVTLRDIAPIDPWCNMLQALLGRKKYEEAMSDEHPRKHHYKR